MAIEVLIPFVLQYLYHSVLSVNSITIIITIIIIIHQHIHYYYYHHHQHTINGQQGCNIAMDSTVKVIDEVLTIMTDKYDDFL